MYDDEHEILPEDEDQVSAEDMQAYLEAVVEQQMTAGSIGKPAGRAPKLVGTDRHTRPRQRRPSLM